jgi:hypothetical protein
MKPGTFCAFIQLINSVFDSVLPAINKLVSFMHYIVPRLKREKNLFFLQHGAKTFL